MYLYLTGDKQIGLDTDAYPWYICHNNRPTMVVWLHRVCLGFLPMWVSCNIYTPIFATEIAWKLFSKKANLKLKVINGWFVQ